MRGSKLAKIKINNALSTPSLFPPNFRGLKLTEFQSFKIVTLYKSFKGVPRVTHRNRRL
jgi:hypothetical protein